MKLYGADQRYTIITTRFGVVGLARSERGLTAVALPDPSPEVSLRALNVGRNVVEDAAAFGDLPLRLKRYFDGERVAFPDELDLSCGTPFMQAVWQATRSIPYGETTSYAWLAGQIGNPGAARAVGNALGRNPFPIIVPCHRVLASNGGLGGFSGGLEMKRRLLALESVKGI